MARVLIIAYSTYVRDARIKRHARALAERGDLVDVLCLENPEVGVHDGVTVMGLKLARYRGRNRIGYLGNYLRFVIMATLTALRLGLKRHYDVVIACTMPDTTVFCGLPLKLFGSKVVLDVQDTMPELYREKFSDRYALGAWALALQEVTSMWLANRVLAVHDLHRRRLEQTGIKAAKIAVVLNVPDQRIFRFRPVDYRRSDSFTIVCHGTIVRRLGLDVALSAMALIRDRLRDVRLVVIGQGDYLHEYQAEVGRLGLQDIVRFLAPVPLESLPRLLESASLGLIPNRAGEATHLMLPVKLLEYAALGIPIVTARLRTISHYFDEGAVRFFEPGDPTGLALAIEDLYRDPVARCELAYQARKVLESLGWEHQRVNYYHVIDAVLGAPDRGLTEDNTDTDRPMGPDAYRTHFLP